VCEGVRGKESEIGKEKERAEGTGRRSLWLADDAGRGAVKVNGSICRV
jgi:hypothetical protein